MVKKTYRKKAYKKKPVISKAVKSYVKKAIDMNEREDPRYSETIYLDTQIWRGSSNSVNGELTDSMTRGITNLAQLIGSKVKPYRIVGSFTVEPDENTYLSLYRCIIFQDTSTKYALPSATDVKDNSDPNFHLSNETYDSEGRFRILYDKTLTVDKAVGPRYHHFKFDVKANMRPIVYSENSLIGTIAECVNNGIFILMTTNTAVDTGVVVNGKVRMYYEDN